MREFILSMTIPYIIMGVSALIILWIIRKQKEAAERRNRRELQEHYNNLKRK